MSGITNRNDALRKQIEAVLDFHKATPQLRASILEVLRSRVFEVRNSYTLYEKFEDSKAADTLHRIKTNAVYASMADELHKFGCETRVPVEGGWRYEFRVHVLGEP